MEFSFEPDTQYVLGTDPGNVLSFSNIPHCSYYCSIDPTCMGFMLDPDRFCWLKYEMLDGIPQTGYLSFRKGIHSCSSIDAYIL